MTKLIEVQEDVMFSSPGSSIASESDSDILFYDAIDGNEETLELPETTKLFTTFDFHQLSLPILTSDTRSENRSSNCLNSEPMSSAAGFIPNSVSRINSESSCVLPFRQSNFSKDTRQFSFHHPSDSSKKMSSLIEIYRICNDPVARNYKQLDDCREESNREGSLASRMSYASARDNDEVCAASRYHAIDREIGKCYTLPNKLSLIKNVASTISLPSSNSLLDNNSQNSCYTLKDFHSQEKHLGNNSIARASSNDEGDVSGGRKPSAVDRSFFDKGSGECESARCVGISKHEFLELNSPLLPPYELLMPTIIDDKPHFVIDSKNCDPMLREGSSQLSTYTQGALRRKAVLPNDAVVPGRVKCAAGVNFVMALVASKKNAHEGPIWTMKFSLCGNYLATAGKSGLILLWKVLPKNTTCALLDSQDAAEDCSPLSKEVAPNGSYVCQLLSDEPIRRFEEHKGHNVVDLSWSKCNFLLSASLDKTVRLWHVSKSNSIRVFQHVDYVTSVDFNPVDDQYFLSGGFDKKIRVWSITTKRVKEWAQTPDFITAAKYSPDGKLAVVGMMKGQVYFYSTCDGLKYFTQISCRNRHGPKKDGRKVTGLSFRKVLCEEPYSDLRADGRKDGALTCTGDHGPDGSTGKKWAPKARMLLAPLRFLRSKSSVGRFFDQLLVTTNDGRMRLYGMDDFCLLKKFKGSKIPNMQISASFSGSGQNIVCGSEDGRAYIWESAVAHDLKVKLQKFVSHKQYDRTNYCARFGVSETTPPVPRVVTETVFVPEDVAKDAVIGSEISLLTSYQDWSCAMVITSDYAGNIKVFAQQHCLDIVACNAC